MEFVLKTTEPDSIRFTMTITMTLAEWKKVAARLKHVETLSFSDAIDDVIEKANEKFWKVETL